MHIRKNVSRMTVTCSVSICILFFGFGAQAQPRTSFEPGTVFSIPEFGGAVFFAFGGSYSQATLEGNTWVFSGLELNNSSAWFFGDERQIVRATLESFRVGAENCSITITSLFMFDGNQGLEGVDDDYFARRQRMGTVRYNVSGLGTQTFNFGLSPAFGRDPNVRDLFVLIDNDVYDQSDVNQRGDGWDISSDGTIIVNGAMSEGFILCSDYSSQLNDEGRPFCDSHPVLIVSLVLVAVVVLVGVVVRVKTAKSEGKP